MMNLHKKEAAFTLKASGMKVFCSISPCSWMYPDYGLQVQLSLGDEASNAASRLAHDKSIKCSADDLPLDQAKKLAEAWLMNGGAAELRKAEADWAAYQAQYAIQQAKDAEKQQKARKALLAKRKAQGFTHLVRAVIHPSRGDDYIIEAFIKGEPTPADLAALLKKSTVETDYIITAI